MNDRPLSRILKALETITGFKPTRNGKGWKARCPAHDDRNPSLSVSEGSDGRALLHCFAGCAVEAIVAGIGKTLRDLLPNDLLARPPFGSANRRGKKALPVASELNFETAEAAIADWERQLGTKSATWRYCDADGEAVGIVVRWDGPNGDKNIRPVSRHGKHWKMLAMPSPRQLYRLAELTGAERVIVVEGEKCADAVWELGLTATTSAGGANAARHSDWSPLAGKSVVILPDSDAAGQRYANDVASILAALSPKPTVKIVDLPGLSAGGDIVDFVAARDSRTDDEIRSEIEKLVEAAELTQPIEDANEPTGFRPFPVKELPEPIQSFVRDAARAIGCDPSYVALPMLAVLAAAIGHSRCIMLRPDWCEPAIVWVAVVGKSGTMKTPPHKLVMKPLRDLQRAKQREHEAACVQYEQDFARYEAELSAWKQTAKRKPLQAGDPPKKPAPPVFVRLAVSDTTVEALAPILLENPRGVLLERQELRGWIGSFDRYASGKKAGADEAHWLAMHNGDAMTVDRKSTFPRVIYVPAALVSVAGGIQPGILDRVMGTEHRESGLLARLLLAFPPPRSKVWTEAAIPRTVLDAYRTIVERLHEMKPGTDANDDPCPRELPLSASGKAAWIAFYNEHNREQAGLSEALSAAWSKLEGYAARLALIVHCVRCAAGDPALADVETVDEISVRAGVSLSRWFANEARRLYAALEETAEEREGRELVEPIERRGGRVTPRELCQTMRRFRGSTRDAETALKDLAKRGQGHWENPRPGARGGRPTRVFVLSKPTVVYDTPPGDVADDGFVDVDGRYVPGMDAISGASDDDAPPDEVRYRGV